MGLIRTAEVEAVLVTSQFYFCVTAWHNLSAHAQQQLSPHILTRPATAKHTTDWIYRLSMQTRAVPSNLGGRRGWWCWFTGRRGRSRWTSTRSTGLRASCRCIILVVLDHLTCLPFFELR